VSAPRRILVPGGTGFIGGAVARALAEAGDDVVVLGRGGRPAPPGTVLRTVDRNDAAAVAAALGGERFDATLDFSAYDRAAVEALLAAPFAPGRYLFASTGQVCLVGEAPRMPYVEEDSEHPIRPEPPRDSPEHPQWAYGAGKRGAEAAVAEARARGVATLVLRFPVVLGAGDTSLRTWAYVERLLDGGPLLLPDGGAELRRTLWVGDIVRAVRRVLDAWPVGPVYHLAQPAALPVRDMVEAVARAAGRPATFVPVDDAALDAAGLHRSDCSPYSGRWASHLDPSRAVREWGFEATPFADYIDGVVRALLQAPPAASHPGYEARERELALARAARGG